MTTVQTSVVRGSKQCRTGVCVLAARVVEEGLDTDAANLAVIGEVLEQGIHRRLRGDRLAGLHGEAKGVVRPFCHCNA